VTDSIKHARAVKRLARAVELREAQTQTITEILQAVHHDHIIAVESMIVRYRADLLSALWHKRTEIIGAAENHPALAVVLNSLTFSFQLLAREYVPLACNLGVERALHDLQVRGWLRHIIGKPVAKVSVVDSILMENLGYLRDSLLPAMHRELFDDESADVKLDSMKARIGSYAHYLWKAAERSYVVTLREFFMKVKMNTKPKLKLAESTDDPSKLKLTESHVSTLKLVEGGYGSGFWGHPGRPGMRGGSSKGPGRARAIFIMGGGGSGKGSTTKSYVKRYGIQEKDVIDSDAIKKEIPTFANKVDEHGLYGPSGPKSLAEFAKYTPDVQARTEAWVKANTEFKSVADFAKAVDISGGMTHELSSYVAKSRLADALNDGKRSFIYDSVGNKNYVQSYKDAEGDTHPSWSDQAMAKGLAVTIHHVYAPREVALKRNDGRDRTVPEKQLLGTHDKADLIAPIIRAGVKAAQAQGKPITFRHTNAFTIKNLREARALGYTRIGHKGTPSP